jgi:hypothetical protein
MFGGGDGKRKRIIYASSIAIEKQIIQMKPAMSAPNTKGDENAGSIRPFKNN